MKQASERSAAQRLFEYLGTYNEHERIIKTDRKLISDYVLSLLLLICC